MDNQISNSERVDLIILCFIRLKGLRFRLLEMRQIQNLFDCLAFSCFAWNAKLGLPSLGASARAPVK